MAHRAGKRSPITIGTGPHACIEIANHATPGYKSFFMVNIRHKMNLLSLTKYKDKAFDFIDVFLL